MEDSIIFLKNPIPMSKLIHNYVHTVRGNEVWDTDAYFFNHTKNARKLLKNHPALHEGKLCHTEKDNLGIESRFLRSNILRWQVLPQLSKTAKKGINNEIRRICKKKGKLYFGSKKSVGFQLSELLASMTYDTESEIRAIEYEGLTLLHSPLSKNYEAWLKMAVIPSIYLPESLKDDFSPEYWKKRSLDLLERIKAG